MPAVHVCNSKTTTAEAYMAIEDLSGPDHGLELVHLAGVLVEDDLPSGFHGPGQGAVISREGLVQDHKGCDGILGRSLSCSFVELAAQEVVHLLLAHLACTSRHIIRRIQQLL